MEDKVALVTGGASGIGHAFVEALLEKRSKVCFVDINEELGRQAETNLRKQYGDDGTFFKKCDVTSEEELEGAFKAAIDKYGHLDILCNNAGILDETNWQPVIEINLMAMIRGTMLSFKYMGKAAGRARGYVVNMASSAGVIYYPDVPVYNASKHGVVGFTKSIGSMSLDAHGVSVDCICPSATNTPLLGAATQGDLDFDEVLKKEGPFLEPCEVAECFIQLLGEERVSGRAMLVTQKAKRLLNLPTSMDELLRIS